MKMKTMPAKPDRLRVEVAGRPVGVDRANRIIRGYVVALAGPFKSEGRGEFDRASLEKIVELWSANGLKSRFAHPGESSDGLGKFLGRAHNPYLGKAMVERNGAMGEVDAVRADLHLDASAFEANPNGNLGEYILTLAESDSEALSSSLVLRKKSEYRLKQDGTPELDAEGNSLPPLWRPTQLFASDVVDEGDAVDGFLSSVDEEPRWTRDYLERGEGLLNKLFAGQPKRVVRVRLMAFLSRYLDRRYGSEKVNNNRCGCGETGKLGATLGGLLDDLIEAGASDERPREVIIAQMGEASGLPVEEVSAIIRGDDICPPLDVLQAFAKVLESPVGEMVMAAENDGCDYSGADTEGEGEDAPSPDAPPADAPPADAPAPAPMSAKPGILLRRLALKEKAC